MKADFRDERGFKKFRLKSCTTIMQEQQRKALHQKDVEEARVERLRKRQEEKNKGQLNLF